MGGPIDPAAGAPPTEVQPVIERLQALKRQHARLARRKKGDPRKGRAPPLDRTAAHRCYPPFTAVPTDPADPEFTRSFSTSDEREAAKEFFDQYGFVVFRNVVSWGPVQGFTIPKRQCAARITVY